MHFALMLFVLRAVCAENINIRYLHAWFPTWRRALHPTAGPPQPPYPNPTHMANAKCAKLLSSSEGSRTQFFIVSGAFFFNEQTETKRIPIFHH